MYNFVRVSSAFVQKIELFYFILEFGRGLDQLGIDKYGFFRAVLLNVCLQIFLEQMSNHWMGNTILGSEAMSWRRRMPGSMLVDREERGRETSVCPRIRMLRTGWIPD